MDFLAAQNRLNASVMNHLRNCQVRIAGVAVPGIFVSPAQRAKLGVDISDRRPAVQVFSSDVPKYAEDSVIDIDGVPYTVATAEPTGTGFTDLVLERTE